MVQFPAKVIGTATLWLRYADALTNNHINVRVPLRGVFYNENAVSVSKETGRQLRDSAAVYIPYDEGVTGKRYISPGEWAAVPYAEIGGYWSVNLTQPPLILDGESDYEFSWAAPGQLAIEQNSFIRDNPSVKTVVGFTPVLFGSGHMWHFVARCA